MDVDGGAPLRRVRVWDLPTRLFHWTLAVAVIGLAVLHVAAIVFHRVVRRRDLLAPATPASADRAAQRLLALCCAGAAWVAAQGA